MDKRTFRFEIKELDDEQGSFDGHAAAFALDEVGDAIIPGAFKKTLKENKSRPILWQHDYREPIGIEMDAFEDEHGLYVKGQLNLNTQRGREAYALVKQGAIKGLSIGYDVVKQEFQGAVRKLLELRLWEWSLVTFPANLLAGVEGIKEAGPEEFKPEPEVTDEYIRVRVKNPDAFVEGSFRTVTISASKGIKAVMGKLKSPPEGQEGSMVAQSYLFEKSCA